MSDLVLIENFDLSIFEVVNGKVNLTKICQHFGKEIKEWSKLITSKKFLTALEKSEGGKSPIEIIKGGSGEQGTFGTREVALKVAQWISPDFEVFCIKQIDTLLQTGKVELQPNTPSNDIRVVARQLLDELDKKDLIIKEKQEIIESQKPAVDFHKTVNNAINSVTVADFAKILGTGEIKLYKWLRLNEYLMSKPNNRPYQRYLDGGYFKVIEKTFKDQSTGEDKTYFQTLITGKGQTYLTKKFNQSLLLLN
jgi:phage antirepressor YoqD-like protein